MAQEIHIIERRSDGYAPSLRTVRRILRIANRRGLRIDWDYVGVLETGALCFGNGDTMPGTSDLVAIKLSGEYRFMTNAKYLALKLPASKKGK